MATTQQVRKPAKKRTKRLRDALPKRGFEFKLNRDILASAEDAALFKGALERATPNLGRHEVDQALADLMIKAKEVKKQGDTDHGVVFERAGRKMPWASDLKPGIISEIMLCLLSARELHIKFTTMRPNPVDPSTEGPLAKAIDAYTGNSPAAEPEEDYVEMDELNRKYIDDMMNRMRKGLGADWDQYSDYNPTDDEDEGMDKDKEEKKNTQARDDLDAKMGGLRLG